MSVPNKPISLAVLISGGGTTLRNLIDKIAAGKLSAEIRLVVSSSPTAKGLQIAQAAGIATLVVEGKQHATPASFRDAIFDPIRDGGAQLVVMGGFLKHVLIPADFANRVINIHPSLIPAFCGHGMYGHHVHEAVLAAGARQSGCTVHYVDDQYDHGPIILQRAVPVLDDDTPDTLAARVFAAECEALPEAIHRLAAGQTAGKPGR
jgi:formyltetrahydrofolate-dependent phosphoribosylglycinamide formyltransferase